MGRDVEGLIGRFEELAAARSAKLKDFYDPDGATRFLVVQAGPGFRWGTCNSVAEIVENNLRQLESDLSVEASDDLPYLEPWIGTGVYANAFGCDYVFRDDAPPHVHYKYMKIEELKDLEYPDWRKSPIMRMVLDSIDALKSATGAKVPLALTDTQSAFDTATLILDAAEFFASCYLEREIVMDFMGKINRLLIEFSKVQLDAIGEGLLARPGHIMPSLPGGPGISVSDDNLAVSSPEINGIVSLPFDKAVGEAFGGISIHSCGVWTHTMKAAASLGFTTMLDCAVHSSCDPNPNKPEALRDAFIEASSNSKCILKVRAGGSLEEALSIAATLANPAYKLVFQIPYDPATGRETCKRLADVLEKGCRR